MKPAVRLVLPILAALASGCLSKVPPDARANDASWRRQAEVLTAPTNPD